MWRTRYRSLGASAHWANPYSLGEPSNEVGRASTKGPLGEPVLIGRTRTHWASHQTRLGEPVLRGRWASQYYVLCLLGVKSARLATQRTPLQQRPPSTCTAACHLYSARHFHSGQRLRLLGAVPARHIYKCLPRCLLGTSTSACSAHLPRCLLGTSTSACSAHLPRCLLGTFT